MIPPWVLAFLLLSTHLSAKASASRTFRRRDVAPTTLPLPITVTPAENWDGIDGAWSSFYLRVGTPAQFVRVLLSWQAYQMWVIHPSGCASGDSRCVGRRGGIFNTSASVSWQQEGLYGLGIESHLALGGNAYTGFDVVGLGGTGEEGPTLKNVTVADLAVNDYYIGLLGVNPKRTNWTGFAIEDGSPSFMTQLKDQGRIASVSFGYTAGAPYRFTRVLASLTLGGYDSSRFQPNNLTFTFAADNSRDTVVAIQAITTSKNDSASTLVQLLPDPIYALLDSTIAEIWLPLASCQAFEQEFGLLYDNTTNLYLVNSTLHDSLLARNATISFRIGEIFAGGDSITIDFPYAAFDLTAQPPYRGLNQQSAYFPLRRAANDSQITLGRTFMQEAYIAVDYERAQFNLSKVVWQQSYSPKLVAVTSKNSAASTQSSDSNSASTKKVSAGVIAGIAVAGFVVIVCVVVGMCMRHRRKRKSRVQLTRSATVSSEASTAAVTSLHPYFNKAELDSDNGQPRSSPALSAKNTISPLSPEIWASEKDGHQVYELQGCMPDTNMADGRQLTEKDMMRHRERQYNGVDAVAEQQMQRDADEGDEEADTLGAAIRPRHALVDPAHVREATAAESGKRFSFIQGPDQIR